MDTEIVAGFVGLGIGLAVLVALSVFEVRLFRQQHDGEGIWHHWRAHHPMPAWLRRRH